MSSIKNSISIQWFCVIATVVNTNPMVINTVSHFTLLRVHCWWTQLGLFYFYPYKPNSNSITERALFCVCRCAHFKKPQRYFLFFLFCFLILFFTTNCNLWVSKLLFYFLNLFLNTPPLKKYNITVSSFKLPILSAKIFKKLFCKPTYFKDLNLKKNGR
jgi:hypothetical protein